MLPPIPLFDPFRERPPAPRRFRLLRYAFFGALLAAVGVAAVEGATVVVGDNFHTVIPGAIYRSAQLSPASLADHVRRQGIRTVVNLRGCCEDFDWYRNELRTSHGLDVNQEDVFLSANRLPPPAELRRLVEVLDRAERPLVLHCKRGVDRTGLGCVAARLLDSRYSYAAARGQLGVRFGHLPVNGTEMMDEFFALYEAWLGHNQIEHTPAVFRHWATREYLPGPCWAELSAVTVPARVRSGEWSVLRIRARNVSAEEWQLKPGTGTGVHARFVVVGGDGKTRHIGLAGQFTARVPVGESVELELAVPPMRVAGLYSVCVDLVDGRGRSFLQVGSEPLLAELHVE